ncbi:MAG TPA: carbonic anhydrase family protein [Azospirillum sp.]
MSEIGRRKVLTMLGLGAAAACPVCAASLRGAFAAEGAHWGYAEHNGAHKWGELSPDFKTCTFGTDQSPIDLSKGIAADAGAPQLDWKAVPLKVVNNGHTIQVNAPAGGTMTLRGKAYSMLQFHFHSPSEHTLDGKSFPMEVHFVHKAADGELAVLGVFMDQGARHDATEAIWAAMPEQAGPETEVAGATVDPNAFLPKGRRHFRYMGSLTTPPCSEGVVWTMLRESIAVSADQIARFAKLFPLNARPVQPLNRRFLLEG